VVLDYRDEWTLAPSVYAEAGRASWVVDKLLERALLHCAHAVTTATEAFRNELLARFAFLDPARVRAIPNGYDPSDFPANPGTPPTDRFVMTYVGTVFPLTSARGLLEAVRLLYERDPDLARILELRFIGRIVESEAGYFEGTEMMGVRRLGYLPHTKALEELSRSHAAVCILDDVKGAERVYPAKIFEIMYLRRPCLVLAPQGVLSELTRLCNAGEVAAPRDAEGIATVLAGMLREFRDGKAPAFSGAIDIERFDRRRLAGEFADVFQQALGVATKTRHIAALRPPAAAGTMAPRLEDHG
jgi:glycosyltransferase involved in cell wall biosynthesis